MTKLRVLGRAFYKRLAGVRGRRPSSHSVECEIPYVVRSARGELKNNPVDCFERGDAL